MQKALLALPDLGAWLVGLSPLTDSLRTARPPSLAAASSSVWDDLTYDETGDELPS